jgi:diguanylate cyclase (GGDEF)-like protein/PAS domain S-box-containing protein
LPYEPGGSRASNTNTGGQPPKRGYVRSREDLSRAFSMLESAFNATMDAILIADAEGHIFGFNAKFAEMWRIPSEVMAPHRDEQALKVGISRVKDPDGFINRIRELYATPEVESMDVIELIDGRIIERYSVPQRIDGNIVGRVWSFRDVTERNRMQSALLASEARFRSVFDHSAVGIATLEADGRIVATNPALQKFLGYSAEEMFGRRLYHFVPDEDVDGLAGALSAIGGGALRELAVEQRYTRRDGETVWSALTMSRAHDRSNGNALGVIAMVQDIGTRKSAEARLTHQVSHDALTNLANRTLFTRRVDMALQRTRRRDQVVVMSLDIDGFRAVNESAGHSAGDQLLVVTAARLLNATRGSDTVARLGGDEFAILLENARDDDEVRAVADRIIRTMREPVHIHEDSIDTSVSIGIARAHHVADGTNEILFSAGVAMYAAKEAGKGRYRFFEPAMHTAMIERMEIEADLRRATETPSEQFVLQYQPLVRLDTDEVVGVEALVRWNHPQRGELLPADFIPIAEETGLIVPLGRWVLGAACTQASAWWRDLPAGNHMTVSVNVTDRQIQDASFVSDIRKALADSGLAPPRLVLEITESTVVQRTEAMTQCLTELHEFGVRLAIDDFGTGHSSLNYLNQFPADMIKIDRSFIDAMSRDPASSAATRTIIGLGATLGLSIVAEGVERAPQRAMLAEFGCAVGQGFLFARPATASQVSERISRPTGPQESPEIL